MANLLLITYILVTSTGISLLISSIATNNWAKFTSLDKFNEGLFTRCYTFEGIEYCHKLYKHVADVPGSLAGVIALMLMAIIFEGLSMIVKVAGVLMEKKLDAGAAFLQLLAIVCGASGLVVYHSKCLKDYQNIDWSYIIGWFGVCLLGIGLVLLFLLFIRRR